MNNIEKLIDILNININVYQDEDGFYCIASNPKIGTVKRYYLNQDYAKKQHNFITDLQQFKLSEDILAEIENIEECLETINKQQNIYRLLQESLEELVRKEYKKQFGEEIHKNAFKEI